MRPNGSPDQAVDVPFTGGMGEGVAPFVVNAPLVELAEDCVITKEGAYRRFPGGSSPAALTGISGGSRGLSVFDDTIVQHTVNGPQQYNETAGSWRASNTKGFVPTQARTDLVISQASRSVYNSQVAVSTNGYKLYVWDETGTTGNFTWRAKGLALRDPSGGWLISPTSTGLGIGPGHQIIAVGATFLIGLSNTLGFQVYTLSETATSVSAITQVVTNATGSSTVVTPPAPSVAYNVTSVQDCCLSTDGSAAYFLVGKYSGSVNSYVYTVTSTGQVGSAATFAWSATGYGAICVDNAKVYIAYTAATSTSVLIQKISEAIVTTGVAGINIGSFTVAGTSEARRVRLCGNNNSGIYCAVESITDAPTTSATQGTATQYTYVNLPSAVYVEIGYLPTTDVIGSYSAEAKRAYAHGYTIASGFQIEASRGPQILLAYYGNDPTVTFYTAGSTEPASGPHTPYGTWQVSSVTGQYNGGVWVELLRRDVVEQENPVTYLSLRSLSRVCWDSLLSDLSLAQPSGASTRLSLCHVYGSFSRSVNHNVASTCFIDAKSYGLRTIYVDTNPKPPLSVLAHGDLYFDGSCQDVWDGQHSFESTPHFPPCVAWVPEIGTLALAGDPLYIPRPAASLTQCTINYTDLWTFYWEWVDGNGYLHRSASSTLQIKLLPVAGAAVAIGGGAYHYAQNNSGTSIPGYFAVLPPLTANNADVFRGLRLVVSYVPGDGSTARTSLLSQWGKPWEQTYAAFEPMRFGNTDDYTSISGGYIYTDGGILEAQASPSPVSITSTRDRLWLISADNRRQLYYSKPLEQLIAPEFNSALTVDIPADAGEGIVVLTVDDKPVVLCERGLYVITGDGPNALGLQGDFIPQIVQSDTGCADKNSTAKCDYGAFFQGERGIYLLDRGLNVSLISQGVQDRAQQDISKAIAVPKEQQVRFGLTDGGILVYHYALKAWTYLNKTAYDAVVWDNHYTRVFNASTFDIIATDESSAVDFESTTTMRLKTSWIKADKMQGFARFKRVLLLHGQQGVVPTAYGPITVNVYFNYEAREGEAGSYVETSTIAPVNRKPADIRSQVDIRIGRQKAESIKLDITCTNYFQQGEEAYYYDPISLEGICLVVGTITNTQFRHLRKQTKS